MSISGVRNFLSNALQTIGNFGASAVVERYEAEMVEQEAQEVFQIGMTVNSGAIIVTIVSVASAFFALLTLSPISFFVSVLIFILARDATQASRNAVALAKKMFNFPYLYASFNPEIRKEIVLSNCFANTVILRNFVSIREIYLKLGA